MKFEESVYEAEEKQTNSRERKKVFNSILPYSYSYIHIFNIYIRLEEVESASSSSVQSIKVRSILNSCADVPGRRKQPMKKTHAYST